MSTLEYRYIFFLTNFHGEFELIRDSLSWDLFYILLMWNVYTLQDVKTRRYHVRKNTKFFVNIYTGCCRTLSKEPHSYWPVEEGWWNLQFVSFCPQMLYTIFGQDWPCNTWGKDEYVLLLNHTCNEQQSHDRSNNMTKEQQLIDCIYIIPYFICHRHVIHVNEIHYLPYIMNNSLFCQLINDKASSSNNFFWSVIGVFHVFPVEYINRSLVAGSKIKVTKSNGEFVLCRFINV